MKKTRFVATCACIGVALSLAACSSESTTDSNAAYCDKQSQVRTEVEALRTLVTSGDATVEQVQEQREAISAALADAQDSAADLADSVRGDVEAADEQFNAAIDAIPGEASLASAAADYAAAIQAWNTSVDSISAEVGCN